MALRKILFSTSLMAFVAACGDDFEPPPGDPVDGGGAGGGSAATGGSSASGGNAATGGSSASGGASGSGGTSASGGTSGGSSGAAGDAGPSCPSTHRCIPSVPSGWEGPIVSTSDAACAAPWATEALVVHDGLNATAAVCACNCTPKANCPAALSFHTSSTGNCHLASSGSSLPPGTCKDATALPTNGFTLPAATPGCTPSVSETIAPTTWTNTHRLCGGATAGGECADPTRMCLPNSGGALCVYKQGDLSCPADYPDKHAYFTSVTDTRDCPATCACTPAGTAQCKATITRYDSLGCTGTTSGQTIYSGAAGTCFSQSAIGGPITPSQTGTCTPQAVSPTGSATPAGPVTVCCAP